MSETRNPDDATAAGSAQLFTSERQSEAEEVLANIGGVELIYQPLTPEEIPEEIKKNLAPQADPTRRMLLARNLAPMPPKEMGLTLFALMNDENKAVREAAEESLDDLPVGLIQTIASQKHPWKLNDYLARNFYTEDDPDRILETIIFNAATGTETLLLLTRVGPPKIVDLIANNQSRLQRSPQIISEFAKNPRVSIALLSRVLEFARRQRLITIDDENRLIDQFLGKVKPEDIVPEKVVHEIKTEDGEVDWEYPSFLTSDFEADADLDAEAEIIESKIKNKLNMRDMVREMTVPQKMRLAVRGNMEARKILVDDALALVAKEVLRNPRVTATEIERAAESRTVDSEVLEQIAKMAAYTRTYAIRHALVTNPKTPLTIANKMLGTLFEKDIKIISKSRAVSSAIQSIARQKIDAQEARRRKAVKKKKK